jgi:predicted secreted protein
MPQKLLAVLFSAIVLLSLCNSAVVPASASESAVISAAASSSEAIIKQISIDESANGSTVTLHVGDSLKINLEYYVIPYTWYLGPFDTSVLQNVDHYKVPIPPPAVGGGTEVWVFTVTGAGTSPVLLEYRPVFGGAADRTFSVTVDVLPPLSVPASSNLTIAILVAGLTVFIVWLSIKKSRPSQM